MIFDISTGFRFQRSVWECSVHICSCPWLGSEVSTSKIIIDKYFKSTTLIGLQFLMTFLKISNMTLAVVQIVNSRLQDNSKLREVIIK
jgi:hypothetical protein